MTKMEIVLFSLLILVCLNQQSLFIKAADPSLYSYYTSGGIHSGLKADSDQFTLNGKHFVIYSGSFHYFRVVPEHWQAVLARFKAAGLNAVQLYIPWNLHEEIPDHWDFDSSALNLAKFLDEIKAADMFAIIRPGPYICAEWELGGYPSWLLRDPHMQLRSMYKGHLDRVQLYMQKVMAIVNKYQFTSGGPVIALQLENEYGWTVKSQSYGAQYLRFLRDIVDKSGFHQLLFTSDPIGTAESVPAKDVFADHVVLETANYNTDGLKHLRTMKSHQPAKPLFASEFWPGWFDAWHDKQHHRYTPAKFEQEMSDLLFTMNGSVNIYMFIGGTNFGFMNGASPDHKPPLRVVTSYDYDAPLSESGNYTDKYYKTRQLYQKLVSTGRFPKIFLPEVPPAPAAHTYGKVEMVSMLTFDTLLEQSTKLSLGAKPVPMELLNLAANYGQRFGLVNYRVESPAPATKSYEVTGEVKDHAVLLADGHRVAVLEDGAKPYHYAVTHAPATATSHRYDLLVENLGRPNFGDAMNHARTGILSGDIRLDGKVADHITAYSLDFSAAYMKKINSLPSSAWQKFDAAHSSSYNFPALYRGHLTVPSGTPQDSYVSLPGGWQKGIVLINGFNLGRYSSAGPQKTLYVPGPLLKAGQVNTIDVFEQISPGHEVQFGDRPILE